MTLAPPPTAHAWRALAPRDRYATAAVAALPRLLGLVDRNPLSPTYGCFDRAYWHYRTMDFPCGMAQEMVLPLALACAWDLPGAEHLRGSERLRHLVVGAIHFARRASHADGTCDDYFPFERAMGALVFSLYAMTESALVLRLHDAPRPPDDWAAMEAFFRRRGDHLARHNETGRLTNHQAFAALALENVHRLTGEERYRRAAQDRAALALSWQHEEGWFQEYEGADPGYHTCTIDFLGKLWQKTGDDALLPPLRRAAEFAEHFLHPDGSYGGEYGSRNTYHFYPHGFELLAARGHGPSRRIADAFLDRALPDAARYFNDDDRMAAHYVYDWMQAWRDMAPRDGEGFDDAAAMAPPPPAGRRWFPAAGLFVERRTADAPLPPRHVVANLRKGGVLKIVGPDGATASDTAPMIRLEDGRVLVAHLMRPADAAAQRADLERGELVTEGPMFFRKRRLPTPWTQLVFRVLTLTVGRFAPNVTRALLQRILITGKPKAPATARRTIRLHGDAVEVVDEIAFAGRPPAGRRVVEVALAPDATSIYVANSNTYQRSVLLPCAFFPEAVAALNEDGRATITRRLA